MSGDRYTIEDQHACYYLTLKIIKWIDVFTRQEYRDIVVSSLNHCIAEKGLEVNAWVIMSNHMHLVASCKKPFKMSDFLRDSKKYTSKRIVEAIQEFPESRRDWMLDKFGFEARRTGRAKDYKLWSDDNHAIDLDNGKIDIWQKIHYIHDNPVRAGIVRNPEDYIYSSAIDYTGKEKGLVKVVVIGLGLLLASQTLLSEILVANEDKGRIGAGCDVEAQRVIVNAPNFTPGLKDGEPVAVRIVLPIIFKLAENKRKKKRNRDRD